jgi:hypothetical protein
MNFKFPKGSIILLIPIVIIVFFETKSCNKSQTFFKSDLTTSIVAIEGNWSGGRSFDYVTKDGITITLLSQPITNLRIGDSISKRSMDWTFEVYRYDSFNNVYYHYKKYDQRHLNR